jgi:hypothetical protein
MICNPFQPTSKRDCKQHGDFANSQWQAARLNIQNGLQWPHADWGTLLERRLALGSRIQISWHWVGISFDMFQNRRCFNSPKTFPNIYYTHCHFSGHNHIYANINNSISPSLSVYIYINTEYTMKLRWHESWSTVFGMQKPWFIQSTNPCPCRSRGANSVGISQHMIAAARNGGKSRSRLWTLEGTAKQTSSSSSSI